MDDNSKTLREQAKDELRKGKMIDTSLYENDLKLLVEELSIYQIELEHQNQELIQSQELLHHSKDRYLDLFDNAPVGYLIVDLNGIIKDINQTACILLESSKQEFIDNKMTKIIHPDFQDIYYLYFRTLINQKHNQTCDIKLRKSNNTYFYARVQGNRQTQLTANDQEFRLAVIDVTIQKEMELKLRIAKEQAEESEERYKALHDASFGGIVIHDKGNIIECNKGLSEITGYSYSELIGMNGLLLISEKTRNDVLNNIQIGYEEPYEAIGLRKNGEEFPLRLEGRNIPYKGKMVRTVEFRDVTGQKQAEEALKESGKKYKELSTLMRLMADNMPDMLWAKNLNREYIFTNKAICNNLLNAKETSEPLGKNDMFFASRERNSHPDNPEWHTFGEICRDSDSITLNEMKPMQFDEFGNVKGKFLFLDVHKAPLYDDMGKLIGVVGSARDVTEAKEAEIQLRKLSQAVKQSPASVVITNTEGTIEYVNPRFTEITGYTFEDAHRQNANYLKSEEQPEEINKNLWETILKGNTWHGEFYNKKKNGELFWESASISPITNDEGKITHFVAVKEDITQRKALEQDLKYQSNLQELLMEISSGFINIPLQNVDAAIQNSLKKLGIFVNADRSYIFEYNWGKEVANNTFEWCAEGICSEISNLQNLPLSLSFEIVEFHKRGEIFFMADVSNLPDDYTMKKFYESQQVLSFVTVPMMDEGNCIGFVGFDSVKQHRVYTVAELQLLEIFARMLVNIWLRKDAVARLVIAKEKAEESDRLKSAFLANMSHEIRTPMNGILGFSELLKEPALSGEKQQEYIRIIEKSGARMLNIINDIVDISKIEAGLMKLDIKESNINEQIEHIYMFFRPEVEAKGMKLSFNTPLPAKEATITTDPEKVYAILTNLVKNAIKYSKEGAIELGYKTVETQGIAFLQFYVKDTGIGIPKDRQEAIFERFIQADIADKMARQGAGLGLSISKAYVEMLKGKIWVESEEGTGSTFYFTLPYNALPIKEIANQEFETSNKTNQARKLNFLVAEDDETSGELISILIRKFANEIINVQNGRDAMKACRDNPAIDLILMDIQMPEMNGYEATRQIRQFNTKVVIIALTAFALTGDKEKAIEAGCNDYISKPVRKDELIGLIQKYFGK